MSPSRPQTILFADVSGSTRLFETSRLANFDTGGNYDFLVSLGDKAPPGLMLSARHHNNWPQTARNRSFVERFHSLTGRYPTYAAEGAYTGVMVLAAASQKAGTAWAPSVSASSNRSQTPW